MTQNFTGVGLVKLHARTGTGAKGIGDEMGNCPAFRIKADPTAIERESSMDTSRSPLRRQTKTTSAGVEIVADEFNKKNFARFVRGRIDEVSADAVTTINTVFPTGAVVGQVLSVPQRNINTQVITDSTATPKTLVAGVNYEADNFAGDIKLLDITTGGPYVQPFKSAHKQGAVTIIAGLAVPETEIWVAMAGTNTDNGLRGVLDTYRVRLNPASVFEYINSEYQDFTLEGAALVDLTKVAGAVGGQIYQFALPSTHE